MVQKLEHIAKKIVQLRRSLGDKTQEAFGKRFASPVKRSTIAHWETGRTEPSSAHIIEMANFKGDVAWWWKLYLVDDVVTPEDQIDYHQSGTRANWMRASELQEMMAFEPTDEDIAEMEAERIAPPKSGPLIAAFNLPAEKQIEAITNVLNYDPNEKAKTAGGLSQVATIVEEWEQDEKEQEFKRKTKNFKQAVVHFLNKKLDVTSSDYWDAVYKRGTLRARADFCDGVSLFLIVNEQSKFKNEALGRNLGKLLLLEKMRGNPLNKMLAICTDVENPKVNHLMLDDISAAKEMGITLTYVTPNDEEVLAEEILSFIKTNLEKKNAKLKGGIGSLGIGHPTPTDSELPPGLLS